MPKLETKTTYFELDAVPHPLNKCRAIVKDDNVGLAEVGAGGKIQWVDPVPFGTWTDLSDTPYASKALLLTAIGAICYG